VQQPCFLFSSCGPIIFSFIIMWPFVDSTKHISDKIRNEIVYLS
jgi:hypothetical protein